MIFFGGVSMNMILFGIPGAVSKSCFVPSHSKWMLKEMFAFVMHMFQGKF